MDIFENFSALFQEVWKKGILGIDIFQILIGLGIFLIFLLFRGLISKVIIRRLEKIAKILQKILLKVGLIIFLIMTPIHGKWKLPQEELLLGHLI